MYTNQVDAVVKKTMAEVYPALGVTDVQMKDFIRLDQDNPAVKP
jgi:hypothetical protein